MEKLEKIEVLLGVGVVDVLKKVEEKVKSFATIEVNGQEGQMLVVDKSLFDTNEDVYVIESNGYYISNTNETNVIVLSLAIKYLKNGMKIETLDNNDELKAVKQLIRSINVQELSSTVKYVKDNELLTTHIGKVFNSYITKAELLQQIVPVEYEEQHITYFKRLAEMKKVVSFNAPVVTKDNDLKDRLGIYLSDNNYLALKDAIEFKEMILLSGPTGTGKTKIAKTLLKDMNIPFEFIECSAEKRYADIMIATTLDENNKLTYSLGKALICYTKGFPLLLDEFTALNDTIYKAILSLLQEEEVSVEVDQRNEDGEMVRSLTFQRHPNFFVIATANEEKRYNVNVLTPQVKRRFPTILTINYLPKADEIEFVNTHLEKMGLHFDEVEKYVEIANLLRANKFTVATSTVLNWAKKSVNLGIQNGSAVALVPQICFTQQELKQVNDILGTKLNLAPVQLFI